MTYVNKGVVAMVMCSALSLAAPAYAQVNGPVGGAGISGSTGYASADKTEKSNVGNAMVNNGGQDKADVTPQPNDVGGSDSADAGAGKQISMGANGDANITASHSRKLAHNAGPTSSERAQTRALNQKQLGMSGSASTNATYKP